MREEVVGHDFRKRKLLTQTYRIQNFASQSGLLSKFCYAKPPIQNFASQSGLRPPHHGHDFRKRKLPLATAPSCAVSRSKHFATQNGLRPPRFLRGAYFAVHKRQRSSLFLTAPFSSGCILVRSVFAILRVYSFTNKKIATCKAAK